MNNRPFVFDDGHAYEETMVPWLRPVGETFVDWLDPPSGLKWIDVGCGTGVSIELLIQRCAPRAVEGIDPSEAQLNIARARPALRDVSLRNGSAMALPHEDDSFDAALMAGVVPAVPDPARCVSEMARVVRSGGIVAAYQWDITNGGFPHEPVLAELKTFGITEPLPPSGAATGVDRLREIWTGAGLRSVETREVLVEREFPTFEAFWNAIMMVTLRPTIAAMSAEAVEQLKDHVRRKVTTRSDGTVVGCGRATAVKGWVA
jgi:ubiquinone/menaquinone biosynthesis C-methylase UbiE